MKVSKESIVGVLIALQLTSEKEGRREFEEYIAMEQLIAEYIKEIPGVTVEMPEYIPEGPPILMIKLDEEKLKRTASDVATELRNGAPPIHTREKLIAEGILYMHSLNLDEEQASIVGKRLHAAITGK